MKDKLKGLVVGIGIGALLTGTAGYAAESSPIDVYFKNIKFLFDGDQKQPAADQKTFIYDGTTYVPLRFVSEALDKEVEYNGDTETITVDRKVIVASYMNDDKLETVSRKEFTKYVAIRTLLNETNDDIDENAAINDLIATRLLYSRGDAAIKKAVQDQALLQQQLAKAKAKASIGSGWDQKQKQLKLSDSDILNYLAAQIVADQTLKATAGDDVLQPKYDELKATHEFDYVTLKQIVVDTKNRTKEAALARATEAQEKLLNGEDFDEVAKAYTDNANVTKVENVAVNELSAGVREAAVELPIGEISGAVETDSGYRIMKIESRTTKKFEDVKAQLRDLVLPTLSEEFKQIELQGVIVELNLDAE